MRSGGGFVKKVISSLMVDQQQPEMPMGWMVDGDRSPLERKGDWEATTSCFIELVATPVLLSLHYTLLGERLELWTHSESGGTRSSTKSKQTLHIIHAQGSI